MGETRSVRRSLSALSTELAGHGFSACPTTVARLLRAEGYSPRINVTVRPRASSKPGGQSR